MYSVSWIDSILENICISGDSGKTQLALLIAFLIFRLYHRACLFPLTKLFCKQICVCDLLLACHADIFYRAEVLNPAHTVESRGEVLIHANPWGPKPVTSEPLGMSSLSSVQFSRSVVSNSLRPHESQHTRPPCPSPTPGVYSDSCPSSW